MGAGEVSGNRLAESASRRGGIALLGVAALLTASWLLPSSARAATIGQLAQAPTNTFCGNATSDYLQPTVNSGNTYVVPPFGATITSWSTQAANSAPGAMVSFKVFRGLGGNTYRVVGLDGPRTIVPFSLNTFPTSIPVQPGDVIGFFLVNGNVAAHTCDFAAPGETYLFKFPGLAVGEQGDYVPISNNTRLNVAAEVKPSSDFSFGKLKRKVNKGIAILKVKVPGPGTLRMSGKKVKSIKASASKTADGPGTVKLKIRAKGKAKKRLNSVGLSKVKAKITYTPTGGDPNSRTKKAKLKKR